MPSQWRDGGYFNHARSGFSTQQVLDGSGVDACTDTYQAGGQGTSSPIIDAVNELNGHDGSWNRVVITAGVDDTNWYDLLKTTGLDSLMSTDWVYGDAQCRGDVGTKWSGWSGSVADQTTSNARHIMDWLTGTGQDVKVFWISYYNIAGTGAPAPGSCAGAFNEAMGTLHSHIRANLDSNSYTWIDVSAAMNGRGDRIQDWYLTDTLDALALLNGPHTGWPHPDTNGVRAISDSIQIN